MTARAFSISAMFLATWLAHGASAQEQDQSSDPSPTDTEEIGEDLRIQDAFETDLNDFLWVNRAIVVFADTPADPRYREQLALLQDRPEPLLARDVIIITDTDPAMRSAIRAELRPRGFMLVVMTKDGAVGFRRPSPRDVREITRGIDNFSIRQEEMLLGG